MPRILVLYYSSSGNTEKMAGAVAEGAKAIPEVDVELSFYVPAEKLAEHDAIIIGAPTYHHDMTNSTKKVFEEASSKNINLNGKWGAAFGSYGWSGEAPKLVLEIMKNKFAMKVIEPPFLVKYSPDESALSECRQLGKKVAETLHR